MARGRPPPRGASVARRRLPRGSDAPGGEPGGGLNFPSPTFLVCGFHYDEPADPLQPALDPFVETRDRRFNEYSKTEKYDRQNINAALDDLQSDEGDREKLRQRIFERLASERALPCQRPFADEKAASTIGSVAHGRCRAQRDN